MCSKVVKTRRAFSAISAGGTFEMPCMRKEARVTLSMISRQSCMIRAKAKGERHKGYHSTRTCTESSSARRSSGNLCKETSIRAANESTLYNSGAETYHAMRLKQIQTKTARAIIAHLGLEKKSTCQVLIMVSKRD